MSMLANSSSRLLSLSSAFCTDAGHSTESVAVWALGFSIYVSTNSDVRSGSIARWMSTQYCASPTAQHSNVQMISTERLHKDLLIFIFLDSNPKNYTWNLLYCRQNCLYYFLFCYLYNKDCIETESIISILLTIQTLNCWNQIAILQWLLAIYCYIAWNCNQFQ